MSATTFSINRQSLSPVRETERVQIIDILRGFALFGILLVNMEFFNNSFIGMAMMTNKSLTPIDQLARWFIAFFGEGKFYSIFSFLFGLGMWIQHSRAQQAGRRFAPFYLRRLGVLWLIGLIHAYLFWVGDILILYSVLGVVALLFFRNRQPRTLLIWTFIFLLLPLLINGALFGLTELGRMSPGGEAMMAQVFAEQEQGFRLADAQADLVYATGTFVEITRQRAQDMNTVYITWPFMAFNVLAMFLLGLYAGKRSILTDVQNNLPLIRKVWLWGLIVGLIGNLLYVIAGGLAIRTVPSVQLLVSLVGQTFGAPALSLFYMSSLTLLTQNETWQKRLSPLASVGRMAISNYLMQTLICTTLFYGYGFGLYGKVGPATGILLTAAIYLIQIPVSNWWLSHLRFGPVEWLWRTLTYGHLQPMRYPTQPTPSPAHG